MRFYKIIFLFLVGVAVCRGYVEAPDDFAYILTPSWEWVKEKNRLCLKVPLAEYSDNNWPEVKAFYGQVEKKWARKLQNSKDEQGEKYAILWWWDQLSFEREVESIPLPKSTYETLLYPFLEKNKKKNKKEEEVGLRVTIWKFCDTFIEERRARTYSPDPIGLLAVYPDLRILGVGAVAYLSKGSEVVLDPSLTEYPIIPYRVVAHLIYTEDGKWLRIQLYQYLTYQPFKNSAPSSDHIGAHGGMIYKEDLLPFHFLYGWYDRKESYPTLALALSNYRHKPEANNFLARRNYVLVYGPDWLPQLGGHEWEAFDPNSYKEGPLPLDRSLIRFEPKKTHLEIYLSRKLFHDSPYEEYTIDFFTAELDKFHAKKEHWPSLQSLLRGSMTIHIPLPRVKIHFADEDPCCPIPKEIFEGK